MVKQQSPLDRFLSFFSSLRCGLLLLALVGTATILGTLILQRPMARQGQIEQLYAPQTIHLLDALGLFDVFHAWWFILLLSLLGANITLASLERFPQVWRLFARPHVLADALFLRALPFKRELPLGPHSPDEALQVATRRLETLGFKPRPESLEKGTLYIEKHRWARLAPYVVHASLLIIFAGAIFDGTYGYRGFMSLQPGTESRTVEPLAMPAPNRELGFAIRCDGAGMETYPDGSPRQYWSQLAVIENGREVLHKRIYVNAPLTYKGVRFFQASYGSTGNPRKLEMDASWSEDGRAMRALLSLVPGQPVKLGPNAATVELADFIPDFVVEGNQIGTRSEEPRNPAIRLAVTQPDGKQSSVWILPKAPDMSPPNRTGIEFQFRSVDMEYMTGLQVAHEPGQWFIWGGCLLLTCGLMMALYFSHVRIWGIVACDRNGKSVLLLGGQPSKYRESFERRFNELAGEVEKALSTTPAGLPEAIPA